MTRLAVLLIAILAATANVAAQPASVEAQWPKKVIRFIVSAAPGSAGDTICRIVAQKLGERLGQQFVIDNRAAAAGTIAGEGLARSAPDGYTIGMVTTSTHVIAAILNPNLSYDPVKDFAPVSMIGHSPYVLAVFPGLPVNNVAELVALAKAKPRQLNNAAFGTTSLGHLASLLFANAAGIEINQVPYRSSAQAVLDAVAGRIEMQFSTLPPAIPLIREGRLRALATTGAKRVTSLPDVPTLAEAGIAGYEVSLWMGIAAPAGTPRGIVSRLNQEMSEILILPEITNALLQQGMTAEPGSPEDLGRRIGGDIGKWRDAVTKAGIKAE
jgi:tripartite-type tricarboxylate transporter receptor subunit TctC